MNRRPPTSYRQIGGSWFGSTLVVAMSFSHRSILAAVMLSSSGKQSPAIDLGMSSPRPRSSRYPQSRPKKYRTSNGQSATVRDVRRAGLTERMRAISLLHHSSADQLGCDALSRRDLLPGNSDEVRELILHVSGAHRSH